MKTLSVLLCSIAVVITTALTQPPSDPKFSTTSSALASSYLDALGGPPADVKPASYGISGGSFNSVTPIPGSYQVPQSSTMVSPLAPEPLPVPSATIEEVSSIQFPFAPASSFGMEYLVSKGPRPSDWGTPADATRKLSDDGTFRAGAWYCSEGGWPSPNGKAVTETFYVLEGNGSLDDADGVRHYFGPGDHVIIPKGHTGRWDVMKPIRKVWAVNAHENIEERSTPIRVQVDHYSSWAPQFLTKNIDGNDPLYGYTSDASTVSSSKVFYDVGPTQVGVWSSEPGSYVVSKGKRAWIHILEGVVCVTSGTDGSARRCVAGDTIVVPAGWYGHVDVIETTKKLWTVGL